MDYKACDCGADHITYEEAYAAFPRPMAPYAQYFMRPEAMRNGAYEWYVPLTTSTYIYGLRLMAKELNQAADNLDVHKE